jgi:hypothetical protein
MSYYARIEGEIREHLLRVIEIVRPYARSTGRFHDWPSRVAKRSPPPT